MTLNEKLFPAIVKTGIAEKSERKEEWKKWKDDEKRELEKRKENVEITRTEFIYIYTQITEFITINTYSTICRMHLLTVVGCIDNRRRKPDDDKCLYHIWR